MAGASASIYLARPCDDRVAIEIHAQLEAMCSRVEATRKGRVWDVWIGSRHPGNSRPFSLHLKSTGDNLTECEDELLELEIDESTHPSCLVIAAGCNQEEDRIAMQQLLESLTNLGGIAGRPVK